MWTYTGTVAFSAPEIFSGNPYKYNLTKKVTLLLVRLLTCGVQGVFYL